MPRYSKASDIEQEVWMMKLADQGRGKDRALIDNLFNGDPPFPVGDRKGPNTVNTSFLEATKIYHDAARQFSNAFLKPGNFFTVKTDLGPKHKRAENSSIITTQINRIMKQSMPWRETQKNVFSSTIVHGIGPSTWDNRERWNCKMQSLGDVMIPSRTELAMDGMDKFAIYRRYTAEQLGRMIAGPHVDKAWDVPLVKKGMAWARNQSGVAQQDFENIAYSPERIVEDFKENAGIYSADRVPTVNCWDFYFLDDEDSDNYGWKRRIILDTAEASVSPSTLNILEGRNEFLYDSKDRNYARKLSEILHCQYGNGSTVAPFRWHNVRGLGLLLHSVCQLQNRLRCRFTEAAFEATMQYFTGDTTVDEAEALIKATLIDKGFIPPGLKFVGQNERWHVDLQMLQMALQMNRKTMEDNSTAYTQDFDFSQDKREKTATQVTAEVSSASALVAAMLSEAYGYEEYRYREQGRRFCIKDSKDPDVRKFRVECLKRGVSEECLNVESWDIRADRIIGGGNKQMELAQINLLMQNFQRFGPKQQKIILHKATLAWTDDPGMADELAPIDGDDISDGRLIGQTGFASLMDSGELTPRSGIDERGFIEALIHALTGVIQRVEQTGGMATAEQIMGFDTVAAKITEHIEILGKDPEEKQRVKQYSDQLGKLMNLVKAYKQRLEEKMQEEAAQPDPEAMAKVQAITMQAQTKDAIAKDKHTQATIQKEEKFRQQQQQKDEQFRQTQEANQAKVQEELTANAAKTAQDLALTADQTEHQMALDKAKAEHDSKLKEKEGGADKAPAKKSSGKKSRKDITFKRDKKGIVIGATVEEE